MYATTAHFKCRVPNAATLNPNNFEFDHHPSSINPSHGSLRLGRYHSTYFDARNHQSLKRARQNHPEPPFFQSGSRTTKIQYRLINTDSTPHENSQLLWSSQGRRRDQRSKGGDNERLWHSMVFGHGRNDVSGSGSHSHLRHSGGQARHRVDSSVLNNGNVMPQEQVFESNLSQAFNRWGRNAPADIYTQTFPGDSTNRRDDGGIHQDASISIEFSGFIPQSPSSETPIDVLAGVELNSSNMNLPVAPQIDMPLGYNNWSFDSTGDADMSSYLVNVSPGDAETLELSFLDCSSWPNPWPVENANLPEDANISIPRGSLMANDTAGTSSLRTYPPLSTGEFFPHVSGMHSVLAPIQTPQREITDQTNSSPLWALQDNGRNQLGSNGSSFDWPQYVIPSPGLRAKAYNETSIFTRPETVNADPNGSNLGLLLYPTMDSYVEVRNAHQIYGAAVDIRDLTTLSDQTQIPDIISADPSVLSRFAPSPQSIRLQHQSQPLENHYEGVSANQASQSVLLGSSYFNADSSSLPLDHEFSSSSPGSGSNELLRSYNVVERRSPSGNSTGNDSFWISGGTDTSGSPGHNISMPHSFSSPSLPAQICPRFSQLEDDRIVVQEESNDTEPETQNLLIKSKEGATLQSQSIVSPNSSRKLTWEHTLVVGESFKAIESSPPQSSRKAVRRSGPLDKAVAEGARKMRKLVACLRCSVCKIPCSQDKICQRCQKSGAAPLDSAFGCRAHLRDYTTLFLPRQAVGVFRGASVDRLKERLVVRFKDRCFEIQVSSGPTHPPLNLTVHEFQPRDPGLLIFGKLVRNDKAAALVDVYSPPLGIRQSSPDLIAKLEDHILQICQGKRNYGEVVFGNTSQLAWDMYEAIWYFQQANPQESILQDLIKLYAIQDFMSTSLTVLQDSSEAIFRSLPRPRQLNYEPNSKLIIVNDQIKNFVLGILEPIYASTLHELEKKLRPPNGPEHWALSFCCIMMLNICAEMVQTNTDFRIVNALVDQKKSALGLDKNGNADVPSRGDTVDISRQIENLPIARAIEIFHLVYKTRKPKDGTLRKRGFNPIRDQLDADMQVKLGKSTGTREFILKIQQIVTIHRDNLDAKASVPSFSNGANPIQDHVEFSKRNSGRLVAGFLRSFL